jgi:hypothetical protein
MVEHGELMLDQNVLVDPAAIPANSPRTAPVAGSEMTLDELCKAALQVSDNTAGNLRRAVRRHRVRPQHRRSELTAGPLGDGVEFGGPRRPA